MRFQRIIIVNKAPLLFWESFTVNFTHPVDWPSEGRQVAKQIGPLHPFHIVIAIPPPPPAPFSFFNCCPIMQEPPLAARAVCRVPGAGTGNSARKHYKCPLSSPGRTELPPGATNARALGSLKV